MCSKLNKHHNHNVIRGKRGEIYIQINTQTESSFSNCVLQIASFQTAMCFGLSHTAHKVDLDC